MRLITGFRKNASASSSWGAENRVGLVSLPRSDLSNPFRKYLKKRQTRNITPPNTLLKNARKRIGPIMRSLCHKNKAGHICSYPYSCALRAGASYNYLLVNGERRLTPREMFRLQGFPDSYKIV